MGGRGDACGRKNSEVKDTGKMRDNRRGSQEPQVID